MRSLEQILELLPQLDRVIADELEDQDLDFKEWVARSVDDSFRLVVEICHRSRCRRTPCLEPIIAFLLLASNSLRNSFQPMTENGTPRHGSVIYGTVYGATP